jgi:GDP-4-dehydro-6-deoxy-D-mannose reductase
LPDSEFNLMRTQRNFKSALITGIVGSGGSYLADHIAEAHPQVALHGIARWHTNARSNLTSSGSRALVHECDLLDTGSIVRVLEKTQPDVIFHLASHANVRAGFEVPSAVLQNNIFGTVNLFEAVRLAKQNPIIQLCSTSEVYGQVRPVDVPITEDCPLRPVSPYAVSKTTQDLLGFSYFQCYGLQIVRTRMFAYLNPRRADLFASSFARQVARIEAGLQEELLHGNLDSTRTLIDVRDAMSSYWAAAAFCEAGEVYNIGGNTVITVGQFLEELCRKARKTIRTRQDPTLLRPADVTLQIPCINKFKKATGWEAEYTFQESVDFLLEYWRRQILTEPKL